MYRGGPYKNGLGLDKVIGVDTPPWGLSSFIRRRRETTGDIQTSCLLQCKATTLSWYTARKKNPNQKHYQIWSLSEPCIFRTVHLSFMKLLCLRYFVTVMKSWLIVSGKNSHRADIDTFFMYIFDNID